MLPNNGNNPMNPMLGSMNPGMNPSMMTGGNPNMGPMNPGMGMTPGMNPGMMDPSMGGQIDPTAGMSVYKPQGGGTLLADLIKDDESVGSNGSNRQGGRRQQGYDPRADPRGMDPRGIDPRTDPRGGYGGGAQYDSESDKYSSGRRGRRKTRYDTRGDSARDMGDSESDYDSIRELAADVNNSLMALENIEHSKKKKKRQDTESESDESDKDMSDDSDTHITVETIEYEADYLKTLTEFLLLLTLYVIMSQPFVVSVASGYIQQLNPSEEGTISMTGIIIYGLILTVMFMVVRKIIFSRM